MFLVFRLLLLWNMLNMLMTTVLWTFILSHQNEYTRMNLNFTRYPNWSIPCLLLPVKFYCVLSSLISKNSIFHHLTCYVPHIISTCPRPWLISFVCSEDDDDCPDGHRYDGNKSSWLQYCIRIQIWNSIMNETQTQQRANVASSQATSPSSAIKSTTKQPNNTFKVH